MITAIRCCIQISTTCIEIEYVSIFSIYFFIQLYKNQLLHILRRSIYNAFRNRNSFLTTVITLLFCTHCYLVIFTYNKYSITIL